MRSTLVLTLLCTTMLCACTIPYSTHHSIYQWADYDSLLYASFKDPAQSKDMLSALELHISKMEESKQKIAPGLYAELGTLYLQAGNIDKALTMYSNERTAWPESAVLMTTMMNTIKQGQLKSMVK